MATEFKNTIIKEIGTVPVLGFENGPGRDSTILGISLANLTPGMVYASVLLQDDTSVQGYYIKEVPVPPNSSLRAILPGEKLILGPNNKLFFVCDQNEGLDVIISYVNIL